MIYIYTDRPHPAAEAEEIEPFLKSLELSVAFCGDVMETLIPPAQNEHFAQKCASLRIKEFRKKRNFYKTIPGRFIEEEKAFMAGNQPMALREDTSNVYEGYCLLSALRRFIPQEKLNDLHLIFTSRLPMTWDEKDFRYHGRTVTAEFPLALISTTGLVEAPAKPREYYLYELAKERMKEQGFFTGNAPLIDEKPKFEFLTYDDPRMKECLKGLTLQAIFFLALLEPFCETQTCRLYNAHWQEELLSSQVNGRMCQTHQNLMRTVREVVR